ncbi:hypothetical protein [Bradyrhizobium genomosp. I (2014)]|uniref:hypothetical protein n=1 Tax=Bradyrhizobium genomosp. I (2014) TaxID=2683269 RepID=UPI0004B04407|nr:hypothetical protein [Bradyrhizobium sp. CCBAU 43298]
MTDEAVTLKELIEEQEILITDVVGNMPEPHKRFLLSFERGEPEDAYRPSGVLPICLPSNGGRRI